MANEFIASSESQKPTIAQAGEPDRAFMPAVDLTRLTATEIVAANRYATDERDVTGRYSDAIFDALEELPGQDPAKGLAVFELMSASTNRDDRSDVALCVPGLLKVDHDNGLRLFDQLIRDTDNSVRSAANDVLDRVVFHPEDDTEDTAWRMQLRTEWGVNAAEVERLRLARDQAERGEGRFQLGAAALQKLIDSADQAAPPAAT